jgi:hypothetical protein
MDVRRGVAAALCLPLLAMAACSDDESQAKPKDPTSSAATSPSPSATGPTLPPEAKERTEAGARAFVRHWVAALNHASATGETVSLSAASTKGCETCANYVALVNKIYGPGGRIDSEGWEVVGARAAVASNGTRVALEVEQSPEHITYVDPSKTETFDGGHQQFVARLAWTSDGWRMDRLDIGS